MDLEAEVPRTSLLTENHSFGSLKTMLIHRKVENKGELIL